METDFTRTAARDNASSTRRGRRRARLSPRRLRQAIDFMRTHVAGHVSVGQIAAAASLSVFHFSRAFRGTTGLSPYRYLLHCRVAMACDLLSAGDMPIAEVAAQAGFSDQSHMTNVFRRLSGLTPSQYRRDAQGSSMPRAWPA
jgi:AraC-like DNA-binding protein